MLQVPLKLIRYFNTEMLFLLLLFFFSDIDKCKSSPCKNGGGCVNEQGNYTCTCNAGFTGKLCEKGNVAEFKLPH